MNLVKFGLLLISSVILFGSNPASAANKGKFFDRAIFVIFENTDYSATYKQPFFKSLAAQGANLTHFAAEAHPSQANYVALTSGTLGGVTGDKKYDLDLTNIVDLLEQKGISWKVYAEGYPGGCSTTMTAGRYARKHIPFISYINIQTNPARCAKIVDESEFDRDVAAGQLPEYVFYVPNMDNDGHDTGVSYADQWYNGKFGPLVSDSKFMQNTALITTFDENAGSPGNLIYTSVVGPAVNAGTYDTPVSHYSLLRLVEDNWNLGTLQRLDEKASPIPNIWK
jgi:hypothetical protein